MTPLIYRAGLNTYEVCPSCWAYGLDITRHDCTLDWPRYLKGCGCPACKTFRSWIDAGSDR